MALGLAVEGLEGSSELVDFIGLGRGSD